MADDNDISRTAKFLKNFDKAARHMRKAAVSIHGDEFADNIVSEARLEFEALIPEIPYIGGKTNRLTGEALIPAVACLALYRALKKRGKTVGDAGEIIDGTVQSQLDSLPGLLVHLVGRYRSSKLYLKKMKKRAAISQERRYPGDWVFAIIDGDGEEFDYGINFTECGICKFFSAHDAEELIPYMCAVDFPVSKVMNSGLVRTTTLAEGADKCNFRFKRGGKVHFVGNPTNRRLIERLEELGFFKYLEPGQAADLKSEMAEMGWTAVFWDSGRYFSADAEDLAEWGVASFLKDIQPFLEKQGIRLESIEESDIEDHYKIMVNGRTHLIWSRKEMKIDINGEQRGLLWGLAPSRCFSIVNQLLIEADSNERIYAVNGGNDLDGFFLTEEQYRLICQHPSADPGYGPYVITEEYPNHGWPGWKKPS